MKNFHREAIDEIKELARTHSNTCQPLADEILWVVSALEEETPGQISKLSTDAMLGLIERLKAAGYFDRQTQIRRALYSALSQYPDRRAFSLVFQLGGVESPFESIGSYTVNVRLPPGLDPTSARWLAKRQIHEQIGEE